MRKRSNNLDKLHEFENYLLIKQKQTHEISARREKHISNLRDKSCRGSKIKQEYTGLATRVLLNGSNKSYAP